MLALGWELILASGVIMLLLLSGLPFLLELLRRDLAVPAGCKATSLCRQVDVDKNVFSYCFQQCLSPIDRHRLVSDVIHGRCTSVAPVCTNSCGWWGRTP